MKESWTIDDAGPLSGNAVRATIMAGDDIVCEIPDSVADLNNDGASEAQRRAAAKRDLARIRLIAAAPDLLAACESMLDTWGSNDEDAIIEARDMARAAIAKAVPE